MDYKKIGMKVKLKRVELGKSQRELASEAGISAGTVVNIEKGRGGSMRVLGKMASVLHLQFSELIAAAEEAHS